MAPSFLWKLALGLTLLTSILASASVRAPRRPLPRAEMRWLLLGALALYAVGIVALLKHQTQAAVIVSAAGVATSSLAAWLSRGGHGWGGPPGPEEPIDERPPPDPDGVPRFDWAQFEQGFRAYAERRGERLRVR